MNSPKNNININNNIINTKSNMLNDHEFVATLNLLSCNIKDFYKGYRKCLEVTKSNNESLIENILIIKNQFIEYTNSVSPSITSNNLKNTLSIENSLNILDPLNKVSEIKNLITSNLKSFENSIINFYDDSKSLFKSLKSIHSSYSEIDKNYLILNNVYIIFYLSVQKNFNLSSGRNQNNKSKYNEYLQNPSHLFNSCRTNKSVNERSKIV